MRTFVFLLTCLSVLGIGFPSQANDTIAAIETGQLTLKQSKDLRLLSEDLRINPYRISVSYQFENDSDHAINTEVAFPLPLTFDAADPLWNGDFNVRVNGTPRTFALSCRALLNDKDVSQELTSLSLRLNGFTNWQDLTPAQQKKAAEKGLYSTANMDEEMAPAYGLSCAYHWRQIFPPHKKLQIAHSYPPGLGSNSIGVLDFSEKWAGLYREENPYLDKDQESLSYMAQYVPYILHTGSNWKNGIESFDLTVDGSDLLFVEIDGQRQTAMGALHLTKKDFKPQKDLLVAFVARRPVATAPKGLTLIKKVAAGTKCLDKPNGQPLHTFSEATAVTLEAWDAPTSDQIKVRTAETTCWVPMDRLSGP